MKKRVLYLVLTTVLLCGCLLIIVNTILNYLAPQNFNFYSTALISREDTSSVHRYSLIHKNIFGSDEIIFNYLEKRTRIGGVPIRLNQHEYFTGPAVDRSLILIGGSFVAGSGLSDQDRISTHLQKRLNQARPGTKVYNYGVPGWSITNFYELLLMDHSIFKTLETKIPTTLYYLYPSFHLDRISITYNQ